MRNWRDMGSARETGFFGNLCLMRVMPWSTEMAGVLSGYWDYAVSALPTLADCLLSE